MDKAPDAYRTISEVGDDLDIAQHVLRFWETRFPQIKPLKRGGGRRYYRPDDVELLKGIRHLLYREGYTIKGVQRILKEQGARAVQDVGRAGRLIAGLQPDPADFSEEPSRSLPVALPAEPDPSPAFSAMRRSEPVPHEGPLPSFPAQWGGGAYVSPPGFAEQPLPAARMPPPVAEWSAPVPEQPPLQPNGEFPATRNLPASPDFQRPAPDSVPPSFAPALPDASAQHRRQALIEALAELEAARGVIAKVLSGR